MNNEIMPKFNSAIQNNIIPPAKNEVPMASFQQTQEEKACDFAQSMDYLGAINKASLNMHQNVTKSVQSYLANPELVEDYNYFCDNLVESGVPLEKAVILAEELRKKQTYQS